MKKNIKFGGEALTQVAKGVEILAKTVGSTLGPGGRNVVFENLGVPLITKDGVTVAREIELKDKLQNIGAQMVKQVANKTCTDAGDGPQPLWAKVLTPNGWKTMGELKIGDKICGTSDEVQYVTGIFSKGRREIYRVVFQDGREVECCENHLWTIVTNLYTNRNVTVKRMMGDYKKVLSNGKIKYKYYVPVSAIHFDEKSVPLDPFLFGLILSCGKICKFGRCQIVINKNSGVDVDALVLPNGLTMKKSVIGKGRAIKLTIKGKSTVGKTIEDYLNECGMTVDGKDISDVYLFNSYSVRWNLMLGLASGGCTEVDSFNLKFVLPSETLRDKVCSIIFSIGRSCKTSIYEGKKGKTYRVKVNLLPRRGLKIVDIVPTGKMTDMMCIKVSNSNELYVTDNYVFTHNTTTATVLADVIVQEGLKVLGTGVNPINVQRGIQKAIDEVVKYIDENIKIDINDDFTKINQIAKVSTNWDGELADVVANAITEVGLEGAIRLDENRGYQTKYKIVDGLQFERGYVAAQFINNPVKQSCDMESPYVLFYSGSIKSPEDLLPLLKEAKREKVNLFLIADEYSPDVLEQLVLSKNRAGVSVCAIKAPHYKDMRYDSMQDIATLMGGTFIDSVDGDIPLGMVRLKHCGRCDKAICTLYRCSFVGFGNQYSTKEEKEAWNKRLDDRICQIKELANDEEADKLPRENAKLRLKQIRAKAAIISIGASSEVEYQEKLDRADDALRATRCAMMDGVVPGAGYSYLKSSKCDGLIELLNSSNDGERIGAKIVQKALIAPFKKLMSNAGLGDESGVLIGDILKRDNDWVGYNLKTGKMENLIEAGVIDPWMVTKSALRNAGSVAGLIITTEAVVADDEDAIIRDVTKSIPTM